MLARLESFLRRWRRRFSRSEWAIHLLGLPVSQGTATEPGLVLIQIDGLSRRQMERAMERGRLPFLKRLIQREHYETRTFYPGLPSTTAAVQAELYYGTRCAVPAFSYFDRSVHQMITMFTPACAKEIQGRVGKNDTGLLHGGSSWSNIYCGGAADEETHFCSAGMGVSDLFRKRPLVRLLTFPLFHLPSVIKIVLLLLTEFFIAVWDLFHGVVRGESVWEEFKLLGKRVFLCVGLRELLTIGVKIDAARGVPITHVNFLGYDEQAHRRGPSSALAHWSLAGIDRAIKNICRAAHRSARRDYQVWVFSDHGHETTKMFDEVRCTTLEKVISAALDGTGRDNGEVENLAPMRMRFTGERTGRIGEWFRAEVLARFEERPFTVTALGPIGHVYFREPPTPERRRDIAQHLAQEGGVPGVLLCQEGQASEWFYANGSFTIGQDALEFLPHPLRVREHLARDLNCLCRHKSAGDLILLGWSRDAPALTFARERGGHGGPGLDETQGFVLLPAATRMPPDVTDVLRPSDLRATALHFLGRKPLPPSVSKPRSSSRHLRVMTYNVHSCLGMDGRISPRRIAQVINRYNPDIVALQELDLGRLRSQGHDQPRLIAEKLGLHLAFCPTVIENGEQYGHALLSAFPMKIIRTDILRTDRKRSRAQPRGALWVRFDLDGITLNLMNTHFGLRRRERVEQASDLLSEGWIGAISEDERLIVCGDFNMFPRSEPYRALTRRLRDVQGETLEFPPRNTFSSIRPVVRIDHIFVSRHFTPTNVVVPRNHLTRVASDHLPLIADLDFQPAGS